MTDQTDQGDGGGQVRPFAAVLAEINHGEVADQASQQLQELAAAVADQRKKGKITLTLTISPRKGGGTALNVAATSVLTLPAPEPTEAVFFADPVGNLSRDDPRQLPLPLTRVERTTQVRKANE